MFKRLASLVIAAVLALGMIACDESAKSTAGSNKDDSLGISGSSTAFEAPNTENIPDFSEKWEKYENLYSEYWKGHERNNASIAGGWSSDPHTEEEQKEFKRKRIEILSPYPTEKLKTAIAEQCKCVKDNDTDKFMSCLNKECLQYYESYYADLRATYNSYIEHNRTEKAEAFLKSEYTEDLFKNTSEELKGSDWPENIKVSDYEVTDCTTGLRIINENNNPTKVIDKEYIIEISIKFRLENSDLCGEAQIVQTKEHGDLIFVNNKICTVQNYSLKKVNAAAKLAFVTCMNYMNDKTADGEDPKKQINDGFFSKSSSSEGLSVQSTDGLGDGDKYIAKILIDDGDENFTVYIGFNNDCKVSFAQAISNDYPGFIGQYPEPTVLEDKGKITFGKYNNHEQAK